MITFKHFLYRLFYILIKYFLEFALTTKMTRGRNYKTTGVEREV